MYLLTGTKYLLTETMYLLTGTMYLLTGTKYSRFLHLVPIRYKNIRMLVEELMPPE